MTGEVPLHGGRVTSGVVRIGDSVRRPQSANAVFVHLLLRDLEERGFEGSPRFCGIDEEAREILTFLEGDVPNDCGAIVWRDEQLAAAARLLRRFHNTAAASTLRGACEVVCHNDFGPWNLVWRDQLPTGVIDFDNAAPGARLDDLGYAAWKHLNLGLVDLPVAEQRRRLRVLVDAYGADVDCELLRAIERAQERMYALIEAAADQEPKTALEQIERERAWLGVNGSNLIR